MASVNALSVLTVVTEVTLFIIVTILTFLQSYNKLGIQSFQRGFFCDDQSIAYPYKDDTVSDSVAGVIFAGIPVILMILIEGAHCFTSKERQAKGGKETCISYIGQLYRTIGAFLFGCVMTLLLTETMKMFAGRLRPHFLAVCDLDRTKVNCSEGFVFITDGACLGTDEKKLIDARKSFPSGHASMSVFGAIYCIIYLYYRFVWPRRVRIFVPTIQTCIACAAAYVCISRVSDNKHHFSDVLSGSVIGAVMVVLVIKYVSCLKKSRRTTDQTRDQCTTCDQDKTSGQQNKTVPSTVIEMKNV